MTTLFSRLNTAERSVFAVVCILVLVFAGGLAVFVAKHTSISRQHASTTKSYEQLKSDHEEAIKTLATIQAELSRLQQEDQFVRNEQLEATISAIEETYISSVTVYESLVKLKESLDDTDALDDLYAQILTELSKRDYASASATLAKLRSEIAKEQSNLVATFTIPASVTASNQPPGSGYSRQRVETPVGTYMVDIVAADLNSARVVADTASESTCANDCPVMSLGAYAARSGGIAAINGPYFCPASYPSCAGKTNSFDTLLMNRHKTYFNSDNNVYSSVPAVIFSGNSARYVTQSSQWGRDTGVDAVIANQPLLTLNGNRVFGGDAEPKRTGKGSRSFIGSTGSTVYIGVVHNASTEEMAHVLQALGVQNSLNLDSGGSTALWHSGRYVVGPGRDLAVGIVITGR